MAYSQGKKRRKPVRQNIATRIEQAEIRPEDTTSLLRTLSGIVASRMSGNAKLAQIQSLVAELEKPQTASKTADHPGTDDHPVRSLQGKIEREFNRITDESPNSVAASISDRQNDGAYSNSDSVDFETVDIERGLDSLLAAHGVKKRVRGDLARAFAELAKQSKNTKQFAPTLSKLKNLIDESTTRTAVLPPLPDKAPILYAERLDRSQNIIDFLLEPNGWGPWVNHGLLARPDLKKYDIAAYYALGNWLKKNKLPIGMDLPTRSQSIDRLAHSAGIPQPLLPQLGRTLGQRARRASKKIGD